MVRVRRLAGPPCTRESARRKWNASMGLGAAEALGLGLCGGEVGAPLASMKRTRSPSPHHTPDLTESREADRRR